MYVQKINAKLQVGAGAADDLSATGVHSYSFVCLSPFKINRLLALITTAVVSTGGTVIAFKKYVAYGSSSGAVTLGSLTVPAATAKDVVVYKDISPVVFNPGDQLVFEVTTAAAGGGAAGGAVYDAEAQEDPETPPNESKMLLSA